MLQPTSHDEKYYDYSTLDLTNYILQQFYSVPLNNLFVSHHKEVISYHDLRIELLDNKTNPPKNAIFWDLSFI